jgi:hypothetical protein
LAWRIFLKIVENGSLFQIVRFKNGVAIQTTQVVDPIPSHHELSACMLASRHKRCSIPILIKVLNKSSPRIRFNGVQTHED